ncbi:radical SAM protein [Candidatus Poribacteria bacterium]|nr:radical SAM protein [Candidatus Poribacteria bacterium]
MHGWENLTDADRDTILEGIAQGRALGGPYHVEIDAIDICNADCFFCNSAEIRQGDILKWDRLGPLVDEMIAGGLRSFRLAGGGEPLIYPAMGPLCDKMAAAGAVLDNLTTNGIRMTGETLEHLLKLRVTDFFISLNYASPPQYERFMRIPARRFEAVVGNIRKLDARLRQDGRREKSLIHTQFFIHHSTVGDLDELMELARGLPVDSVTIRSVGLIPPEEVLTAEDIAVLRERLPELAERSRGRFWLEYEFGPEGIQDHCGAALRALREKDGAVTAGAAPRTAPIEYCFIGWYSMLIQGTGDVHPCCFLLPDKRVSAFGNLNRQSLGEVWHGQMYQRHRQEMRTAMLMQERTPGQHRRFHCSVPECWESRRCVLAHQLADRPFYELAHARLEELRRRPLTRVARIGNAVSRRLIDEGRALAGSKG